MMSAQETLFSGKKEPFNTKTKAESNMKEREIPTVKRTASMSIIYQYLYVKLVMCTLL